MDSPVIQRKAALYVLLLTLCWYASFYQGINSAAIIWYTNEIFNHCLFVLPAAYYLIFRQRHNLPTSLLKPNYWLAIPLLGAVLLYLFGKAGDIQLFMHVAAFSALPMLWWLILGNTLARRIAFPLVFMLFSIPIGQELIPWLQQITADMSVVLLNLVGVPNFSTGLYIEIPQGRFLVAEACSGISFLIASVVIGLLFTHLNIHHPARKLAFVGLSVAFPIFANAIRVYGIIHIAYLTDMEYAAGADHLIYGWFFFAIVIIGLILLGQFFVDQPRTHKQPCMPPKLNKAEDLNVVLKPLAIVVLVSLPFQLWSSQLEITPSEVDMVSPFSEQAINRTTAIDWEPLYSNAHQQIMGASSEEPELEFFIAWYPAGLGEMLTGLNKLFDEKRWTAVKNTRSQTEIEGAAYNTITITNGNQQRWVTYHYRVDGRIFTDKLRAKLYQTYKILTGDHHRALFVAFSAIEGALIAQPQRQQTELDDLKPAIASTLEALLTQPSEE